MAAGDKLLLDTGTNDKLYLADDGTGPPPSDTSVLLLEAAAGSSPDLTTGVEFDGTNEYYLHGGDLTGVADGTDGTFSCWLKTTTTSKRIFTNNPNASGPAFQTGITNTGRFFIWAEDSSSTDVFYMEGDTVVNDDAWHHVLASWSSASGSAFAHMYVDGVEDKKAGATESTASEVIDYVTASPDWCVGATVAGGQDYVGCLAELWFDDSGFDVGTGGDLITDFYTATGPADLGATGSTPTGTAPLVYLSGGISQWPDNFGTGGSFSAATGTPTDCAVSYSEGGGFGTRPLLLMNVGA